MQWRVLPSPKVPQWFVDAVNASTPLSVDPERSRGVKSYTPTSDGNFAAQLLWQRGIRDLEQLAGFLNPNRYQPASPFAFGQEMKWAVQCLLQARDTGERVTIWGDFDADGITATSVLWEGLGQFLPQHLQLTYYIPNRLTESHGLNRAGIDTLAATGTRLIVTCDTGSTNLDEIAYAQELGIEVIVTDHHTLPPDRPPVVAIINPRYFADDHPLFHLSGVAVAYKLVEALYQTLPEVPQAPIESLLDLVAIGLIADLVQLSGDCRYLAQRGIEQLKQQGKTRSRPGVARLLELCQRSGDRPTDISFGLGPRINAVSRIQGDASFCVELLTSTDETRTQALALDTELANTRRKSLQKDITQQVKAKLDQLDLSTTSAIVLADPQWSPGVLGLVAGQLAQEYGRPTILLSTQEEAGENVETCQQPYGHPSAGTSGSRGAEEHKSIQNPKSPLGQCLLRREVNSRLGTAKIQNPLARGSARSVNNIDLYELVKSQEHLLHRFGGHPYAAGLSLPADNIPLFTEAINQQLRQKFAATGASLMPVVEADLVVNVAQLGKELFQELKLLEPCGMGNPAPKLLIQNCWFENVWNRNTKDVKGRKIQYIKTELEMWDDSTNIGFPGIWWGHYKDEVPKGRCNALVELDFNNYKRRSEVRIIALQATRSDATFNLSSPLDWILDWRGEAEADFPDLEPPLTVRECPTSWDELQVWFRRAIASDRPLAIAYSSPKSPSAQAVWQQLIGIAKFLSRTGKSATLGQLHEKLDISDRALQLGLDALAYLGFQVNHQDWALTVSWHPKDRVSETTSTTAQETIRAFLAVVEEEQFLRQYFYQVPLTTIQAQAARVATNESR